MKTFFYPALLLLQVSFLQAQHYQTVYPDRTAFFDDQYGKVRSLRIDSIENDSILYSFPMIRRDESAGSGCITPFGISWIGAGIILQQDGYNIFFNNDLDTVRIKTNALLNEKWIAGRAGNSTVFEAAITRHDILSFLGLQDSVKTISFQAYDGDMNPVNHTMNDKTLLLSKNYGWIRTFNFHLFPDKQHDGLFDDHEILQEYNLVGLSEPQVGLQNITWFEVYGYQPGDEFHTTWHQQLIFGENVYSRNTLSTILERTDHYPDSIVYLVKRYSHYTVRYQLDILTDIITNDTTRVRVAANPHFDNLPGEPVIDNETDHLYDYRMNSNMPQSKTIPPENTWAMGSISQTCWSDCCSDGGCSTTGTFTKGLGGAYYECSVMGGASGFLRLVYYKKGDITWGTPLTVGIPQAPENSKIEVFPIPAREQVWIKNDGRSPLTIELINLQGQTVRVEQVYSGDSPVNLKHLARGIYLYRISDKTGPVRTGRLILENE